MRTEMRTETTEPHFPVQTWPYIARHGHSTGSCLPRKFHVARYFVSAGGPATSTASSHCQWARRHSLLFGQPSHVISRAFLDMADAKRPSRRETAHGGLHARLRETVTSSSGSGSTTLSAPTLCSRASGMTPPRWEEQDDGAEERGERPQNDKGETQASHAQYEEADHVGT